MASRRLIIAANRLTIAYNAFMGLQCNIDARGQRMRARMGTVFVIGAGLMAALWAWPRGSIVAWAVTGAALAVGLFMLFEARNKWCAMRAMGIKTKI